ncbi:unnamed protein product [Gemmataceae bacterium]|nr:unnamed protein product [Gemmataceae bacterium]VTT98942.1 unnamed protein product [Gemmataceae bacterium]
MPTNPDGTLRPYNTGEIEAWHLGTRGIRTGENPRETYSPNGNGCVRLWLCDWPDRFAVITHLVGQVATWDDSGTTKLTRLLPQAHPTFAQWICVRAVIKGHKFIEDDDTEGAGNLIPTWDAAEIEAQYEQVPFRLLADEDAVDNETLRYTTKPGHVGAEVTSSSQYTTYPGGCLQYKTSDGSPPHNKPIQTNVGFVECDGKFSAIWHRIPENKYEPGQPLFDRLHGDPVAGVRPWIGTANETPLFGRPAATCLLEGVEPVLKPDPIGSGYSWDLKYTWIYKPQTHYRLMFFDPTGAVDPGYVVVMKASALYNDPDNMADTDSFFPLRDHATGLWQIY